MDSSDSILGAGDERGQGAVILPGLIKRFDFIARRNFVYKRALYKPLQCDSLPQRNYTRCGLCS
jgi:hypothetical protein